ncbi:MAG: hypothetical protein WDA02_06765 [Saccharofermentanales bacterium]
MLITKYNNFIEHIFENLEVSDIFNSIKMDIKNNIPVYTVDNSKIQKGNENDNLYYVLYKLKNGYYTISKFYVIDIITELSNRNNPIKKLNIIRLSDSYNGIYEEGKNSKLTYDIYQNFIYKDIDKLINKFSKLKNKKGIKYILPDDNDGFNYIKYNLNNKKIHKTTPSFDKNDKNDKNDNKINNKNTNTNINEGDMVLYSNKKANVVKIEKIDDSNMATLQFIDDDEIYKYPIDIKLLKKIK